MKMYIICFILAFVCLAYYIACATYAGVGSSFIFIWLIGTVFFVVTGGSNLAMQKGLLAIPPIMIKIFTGAVIVGVVLFCVIEACIITNMVKSPDDDCEYLLVLGCQIRGERITKSLRKRLEQAYAYADSHPDTKIIVSGGQGEGEFLSEAQAMYQYLVERGIDGERIICEDQSTDTDENMRYSVRFIEDTNAKVGIVTSNFHIFRAKLLARAKGLHNICGIPSESDPVLFINYMVREAIGVAKDFLFGNFFG